MFTLTILLILAVMVALFGCLMGLFSIIGLFFSLLTGILVGALAGYLASRFMGTQTSFLRNVVLGVLGSFVGEFLFGMFHIYATGSFSSFVISVVGACVCIWICLLYTSRSSRPHCLPVRVRSSSREAVSASSKNIS